MSTFVEYDLQFTAKLAMAQDDSRTVPIEAIRSAIEWGIRDCLGTKAVLAKPMLQLLPNQLEIIK